MLRLQKRSRGKNRQPSHRTIILRKMGRSFHDENQSGNESQDTSLVLAIETSCDETAVAIASGNGEILISEIASQIKLHAPYGGVVPELASRNHNLDLRPLIELTLQKAEVSLSEVSALAATSGPGLASSLLIGDTTAKAMALGLDCPFYSINHMEGHLLSPFISDPAGIRPNISLIVSGGHTLIVKMNAVGDYEILGSTRDDAAGEAFDKVGKMLGLPYPGGPELDLRSVTGNADAYDFPRSMIDSGDYQFSFSGLKTSVFYLLRKLSEQLPEETINDVCASFQKAVVEILVAKLFAAAKEHKANLVTVSGGVSCNSGLRSAMKKAAAASGMDLILAKSGYSTDNAAMIAFAAAARIASGFPPSKLDADIDPNMPLG